MDYFKQRLTYQRLLQTDSLILILAAAVIIVFLPVLFCGFVHFDDQNYILNNPLVVNGSFKKILTSLHSGLYKPVTLVFFAAEYSLFGANPFIYHFNNLVFHLCNALLIFILFLRLSESRFTAFFAALFFAVHPLRVESVAWIAERKDVLYLFFMLLGFLTYLNFKKTASKAQYALSLLCLCLSLLTKPMGVTMPLMLILIDWFSGQKLTLKNQLNKIPYFAIAAVFALMPVLAVTQKTIDLPEYGFGAIDRLLVPLYDVFFYICKTVFPFNLSHYYDYPATIYPLVLGAAAGLLIILAVYFFAYKKPYARKPLFFGFTLFLLSLLPVSGAVAFHGPIACDRYTYFAQSGLFFALFSLLLPLWHAVRTDAKKRRTMLSVIGCFAMLFMTISFLRIGVWKNSITLWEDTVKKSPRSPYVMGFAGNLYHAYGFNDKALEFYGRALELNPGLRAARINRANLYAQTGRYTEALADFMVPINNGTASISTVLSACFILLKLERYDEAIFYAAQLPQNNLDVLSLLISANFAKGNYGEVKRLYDGAKKISPSLTPPANIQAVLNKAQ